MAMGGTEADEEYRKIQALQKDIQSLYLTKQQTLSQFNENTLVKDELDLLTETDTVYKQVGPALLKVEVEEAKGNVQKRLEFIEAEMKKIDNQIGNLYWIKFRD